MNTAAYAINNIFICIEKTWKVVGNDRQCLLIIIGTVILVGSL